MDNKVSEKKFKKYLQITEKALEKARKNSAKGRERQAKEIIEMVENYLSDAKYFKEKGNYVDAFACLNYAHGWLDCGVRLGIFDIKDNKLFTIR